MSEDNQNLENTEVVDALPEDGAPSGDATADRIAALEAELATAKQDILYAHADTQNVRRRLEKELADARAYAATAFARDMLSVADNLTRALAAIPADLRDDEKFKGLVVGLEAAGRGGRRRRPTWRPPRRCSTCSSRRRASYACRCVRDSGVVCCQQHLHHSQQSWGTDEDPREGPWKDWGGEEGEGEAWRRRRAVQHGRAPEDKGAGDSGRTVQRAEDHAVEAGLPPVAECALSPVLRGMQRLSVGPYPGGRFPPQPQPETQPAPQRASASHRVEPLGD